MIQPIVKLKPISFILLSSIGGLFAQNPYTTQNYIAPNNEIYPTTSMDTTKPGWHIVFEDEFTSCLDPNNPPGQQWLVEGGALGNRTFVEHANTTCTTSVWGTNENKGYLVLEALFHNPPVEIPVGSNNYYYYTSGGIKTNDAVYNDFGPGKYYEMRCRLPRGMSYHPSLYQFIIHNFPYGTWNEIDFWENGFAGNHYQHRFNGGYVRGLPNGTDDHCHDTCYPTPVPLGSDWYCANIGASEVPIDASNPAFADEFYTVGVEVQTDYIRWYLNNKLIRVVYTDAGDCINLPDNTDGVLWLELGIDNYAINPWRDFYDPDDSNDPTNDNDSITPADSTYGITTAFTDPNNKYTVDYVRVYEKTCTPVNTAGLYTYNAGYTDENSYPRMTGDINADGEDDIVVFGSTNVKASISNGDGTFTSATTVHTTSFTTSGGWINSNYPRFLMDVNGDDKADIVGMNSSTLYVSLSTTTTGGTTPSFATPVSVSSNFTISNGYGSMNAAPRLMADVNGDNKADIVGFKSTGVYVSLSTCSLSTIGFTTPVALSGLSFITGYTNQGLYPRILEDVNNDSKADIIGFGPNGLQVALSQCGLSTVSFPATTTVWNDLNVSHGYSSMNTHPRIIADVNGDYKKDIIAFGPNNTYIALSQSTASHPTTPYLASFLTPQLGMSFFTINNGGFATQNDNPRFVADINCDNMADIIGIGDGEVKIALSKCVGTTVSYYDYQNSIMGFSKYFNYTSNQTCLRKLADVTGDDKPDLVGFGPTDLQVFSCFSDCTMPGGGTSREGGNNDNQPGSEAGELTIFPNPSSGTFTIRLTHALLTDQIQVLNMLGQEVPFIIQGMLDHEAHLQILSPSKGVHFIRLYDRLGNKYSEKLILE